MSGYQIIHKPIAEIEHLVKEHGAELRQTTLEDTYLIKFNPQTPATDPVINQLRGLIFANGQVLSLGYPVPVEYKDQTPEVQQQILQTPSYVVQEAMDGTLIRLWYHTQLQRWILSTNSVLDANQAYWMGNVSFGQLFQATLNQILENLNRNYVYSFILCHPLNVIVVNHNTAKIYHVTTYDRTTLTEVTANLGIPTPPTVDLTLEQILVKTAESQSKPVSSAGYMVVSKPDADGVVHRYRFENNNYTQARKLRGDCNDINQLIIEHFKNGTITSLLVYYPLYTPNYNWLINQFGKLVKQLLQWYISRHKQHINIAVDARHHWFLNTIHSQLYLNHLRPQNKSVEYNDIYNFLFNQPTKQILHLMYL